MLRRTMWEAEGHGWPRPVRRPDGSKGPMNVSSDRTTAEAGRLTLEEQGWRGLGPQHWNESQAVLAEQALRRNEGELSDQGALVFRTGKYTGRSPKDKFVVREPSSGAQIDWGEVNQPFEPERFEALRRRVADHLIGREVWVQDAF